MYFRKLKRDSMGNNNDLPITDTDRLLLQKDEEVSYKNSIEKHLKLIPKPTIISARA